MPTAKAKLKSASVNASPLKRRRNAAALRMTSASSTRFPTTVVAAMGFKNSGNVRRIVSQYSQMEADMMSLKRRYFESRQKVRALKDTMREQRAKSRQLIVSVALKLHEKEKQIEEMDKSRETELTRISRELVYLQSNLQKKQKRLKQVLGEKDAEIAARDRKIEELTKRLERQLPLPPLSPAKSGLETPASTATSSSSSSEEDNSYGRVPKFEIKPLRKSPKSKRDPAPDDGDAKIMLPPPLPPPRPPMNARFRRRLPPSRGHGADEAFLCTPSVRPPHSPNDGDVSETASLLTNDEGFSSECHEEILPKPFEEFLSENGLEQLKEVTTTPSVTSTNHRTMMKPSDVKNRSNRRSSRPNSELSIVEEHEVSMDGGKIKKITHWTVPFV